MSHDEGRRGVVGAAVAAAADRRAELDQAEQLPMFELPTRLAGERAIDQRARLAAARPPGRPPGSQNRATVAMREYLLARGADPLVQLARYALHTPESLAVELECSKLEAMRELRQIWAELAPYLYGKAVPVDDAGKAVPFFQMLVGGHNVAIAGGPRPWEYLDQQNQGLSDAVPAVSHGEKSHGEAK